MVVRRGISRLTGVIWVGETRSSDAMSVGSGRQDSWVKQSDFESSRKMNDSSSGWFGR